MSKKRPQKQFVEKPQISIDPKILRGIYSNIMGISHTKEEFVMDFGMLIGNRGTINTRIITSPSHIKRIYSVLMDNINKYEQKYGEIKETEKQLDISKLNPAEA